MRRICFVCIFLFAAALCSAELFNKQFSEAERKRLMSGEIVIRFINTAEKVCVEEGITPEIDAVINEIRATNPNYLAEVLWAIPIEHDTKLTDLAESLFCDMNTFKEIPYYSEAFKKTEPLFTIAEQISAETEGTLTTSLARFCMEPFAPYTATLTIKKTADSFMFLHANNEKLKVAIVKAVEKGALKAGVSLVQYDGYWIVYGAGGVKAPKPPFFRKSLEKAFDNRIKDFASFYIKKVQTAHKTPQTAD